MKEGELAPLPSALPPSSPGRRGRGMGGIHHHRHHASGRPSSAIPPSPCIRRTNAHLKASARLVPLMRPQCPIIFDGTWARVRYRCVESNAAHDANDYRLGKEARQETIDILEPNGTLSAAAQSTSGGTASPCAN